MASSFIGRENRRLKCATIIMECYSHGEWFTVHDVMYQWSKRWSKTLTEKELSKTLPILEYDQGGGYLEIEFRPGVNYKFYKFHPVFNEDGTMRPLYVKRTRD